MLLVRYFCPENHWYQDALQILSCKEIHIQGNRVAGGVAENMELEEESRVAAFAASKGRVVTQIAKKNLVQNAIPIFIELKRYGRKISP